MQFRIFAAVALLASTSPVWSCERLDEFDAITSTVAERFYDKTFRGLDWSAIVAAHREEIACSYDEEQLAAALNELLARLKASHTGVYTPRQLDYWALQSIFSRDLAQFQIAFSGIWPERRGDLWYAKYVFPGSAAADAGVSAGDRLVRVDGKSFHPLGFSATADSILVVAARCGVERALRIKAVNQSVQEALLAASRSSERVIDVENTSVGYFHLWSGTHPLQLDALNAALARFEARGIEAIILDLRGGFGGTGLEYLAKLRSSAHLQRIPKYALIDDGTRSGKELLAGTLKHEGIATLVGSTTAGAFLGGSPFRFSEDRFLLLVAVGGFVPPGIGPIEGIGIAPDVEVAPCREYCAGIDPQLERALELIRDLPEPSLAQG